MDEKQGLRAGRYVGSASTVRSPIRTRSRSKQQAEAARREEASKESAVDDDARRAIRAKSGDDVVAAVTSEPCPSPRPPVAPAAPPSLPREVMTTEAPTEEEANIAAAPAAVVAPSSPAPTAKEIAAAEAARQRLYGGGNEARAPPAISNLPRGTPPPATVDVPLRATSELEPISAPEGQGEAPSVSDALSSAVASLDSADWSDVARGLETLRRGVKHHRGEALAVLPSAIPGIASAVSSLRSALCRAGIAAAADVAAAFGADEPWSVVGGRDDDGRSATAGLLPCLLAKAASNDKKFVVDAAASALAVAAARVPAEVLAPTLLEVLRPSDDKSAAAKSDGAATARPPLASLPRGRAAATRALAQVVARVASESSPAARSDLSWLTRAEEETATTSTTATSSLFAKLSAVASDLSRDAWPPARQAARDLRESLQRLGGGRGVGDDEQRKGKENVASRPPQPTLAAFTKAMPPGADVVVLPPPRPPAQREQEQQQVLE